VLPAAAVVIIVGGLFWASVWIVFHTPTTTQVVASPESSELIASSDPIDADALPVDEAYDDADQAVEDDDVDGAVADDEVDGDIVADDVNRAVVADEDAAAGDDASGYVARGPGSADANAYPADQYPSDQYPAGQYPADQYPDEQVADAADDSGAATDEAVAQGPLFGPPYIGSPWEGAFGQGAVASADEDPELDAEGQVASTVAERAAELTSRTLELTAKAEELTARIEGLTSRMEELQTRIEVSGNTLAAVPSPVPSPAPTIARQGNGETVTVRNSVQNVQPPASGKAPWVVLPQPANGSKVPAGSVTLEARARGEAPITQITFQLDGVAVQAAMDRRDDTTWRGQATTRVAAGTHTVAVFVKDEKGRVGSYRWQFTAS
jgi:hypothetical protein